MHAIDAATLHALAEFPQRLEAQFDALVNLPDAAQRAAAIITAMEGIEEEKSF